MIALMFNKTLASNFLQATLHNVEYPTANGLTKEVTCKGIVFIVKTIDMAGCQGFDISTPAEYNASTRNLGGFDHLVTEIDGVETNITDELMAVMGSLPSDDNLFVNGQEADLVGNGLDATPEPVTKSKLRVGLKYVGGALALGLLGAAAFAASVVVNAKR